MLPAGGLILLGNEPVVAAKSPDIRTKCPLSMHGISRDDAVFDQGGAQPGCQGTDLIALVFHRSMRQYQPCLRFVPRQHVYGGLMGVSIPPRPPQRFAIANHPSQRLTPVLPRPL